MINGAPMSYWGGAWRDGGGDNRCPAQEACLGNMARVAFVRPWSGIFDGAYPSLRVSRNLTPARSGTSTTTFRNVVSRRAFSGFDAGGALSHEPREIGGHTVSSWATRSGRAKRSAPTASVHLRGIKAPIVLFASWAQHHAAAGRSTVAASTDRPTKSNRAAR